MDRAAGRTDVLALFFAVACAAAAAAVYLAWLRPALAERGFLERIEGDRQRLHAELTRSLAAVREQQGALAWDLQTVLVAIDEAGTTPDELLAGAGPTR